MNIAIVSGRTTREPDVRYSGDLCVAKFTMAVDRVKDGTDFIPCVAFGKTGEIIEKYVGKGQKIIVTGHNQTGSYEVNGEKRYKMEVIADRVEFTGDKAEKKPVSEQFEMVDEPLPF